ncbi:MAG TPA: hypothetical protein VFJ43_01240 [Bacteroidia bacterium]|nr:hypothetical protein [Bacteroidia bacterium]
MEKFVLNQNEKLLINDPHAIWMKTETMPVDGTIKLTDRRFVFVKNANPIAGILKLFMKSQRSYVLHDFSLESIKTYSRKTLYKNERLIIDNGIERPREYVTSKIESLTGELKNLGIKIKE